MKRHNIAVLVGSLRKESYNLKAAKALTQMAPDSCSMEIIPIRGLPLYNEAAIVNTQRLMLRVLCMLLFLPIGTTLFAQTKPNEDNTQTGAKVSFMKNIPSEDLIKWRRNIHQNAELSFKEENTSRYVEEVLRGFRNIEIVKPAKTSIIGILKGAKPGRTIAFRADMDGIRRI